MNLKIFILINFLFCVTVGFSQNANPDCSQISNVEKILNTTQFKPIPLESVLNHRLRSLFIKNLDPDGLLFTSADTAILQHKKVFENFDKSETACKFLCFTSDFYISKLKRADSIISVCMSRLPDFKQNQTIRFNSDSIAYSADAAGLTALWNKQIKLLILSKWGAEFGDSVQITRSNIDSFYIREKNIGNEIEKNLHCRMNRLIDRCLNKKDYISDIFLNSLTHSYDPHSDYFNLTDLQAFEDMLSSEYLSFGISVDEDKHGEIVISSVNPNSSLYNSGIIKEGDILLGLKIQNEDPVDIQCTDVEEITKILMTTKQNSAEITIRKKDGKSKTIPLSKEKLESSENKITCFILSGDVKIGYIVLPGFYTEFEGQGTPGCAKDVAEVLVRLKQEKIEGLILDLRFNGGGSLEEAIDLGGIFIDRGPMSILEKQNGEFETMKDPNPGTMYDGPMTVLINKESASASEVLAAAFQDYKRALIVGGKSFGKASGQIILPTSNAGVGALTCPGSVKVTVEKIYRINGKTYQRQGIIPDISFPDYTQLYYSGESDYEYALEGGNQTKAANYKPSVLNSYDEIVSKSFKRQLADSAFSKKNASIDSLKKYFKSHAQISLLPENYIIQQQFIGKMIDEAENSYTEQNSDFAVKNDNYTNEILSYQKAAKSANQKILKSIQHDMFIRETYKITRDLIYSQK